MNNQSERFRAPDLPDTSRRARGQGQARNIGRKLWVDNDENKMINDLTEAYNTNASAMIRWLISLGIERVNEMAHTDPIHEEIHERSNSPMAS